VTDRRPNVVVIAVDTLRPDHLGCYGYPRPTAPTIDWLAERSLVFDQAIAAGIPTTPSFTTLFTGLHPYRHGVVTHPGDHLSEATVLLPQLAKAAGYVTLACDNMVVQGAGRGSWFARGYDHYSGFVYAPHGDQSTDITDRALRMMAQASAEPTFLFVHYWDPHTPYDPCPPYDTLHYQRDSGPVDMADVRAIDPEYYQAFLADMKLAEHDDYAYIVAQYDGEISQVDAQLHRLIEGLRSTDAWDDTIVLLVSDHGECFGEGGLYFDHHGLYDAVTKVTMMLRLPGQAGGRTAALVSTEDVMPTLCALADIPVPDYPLTGQSLVPLLDRPQARVRDRVVCVESSRQASLALRTPAHKVILPIVEDRDGRPIPDVYGRPRNPEPQLFDLAADPAESNDLAGECPERAAAMLAELRSWRSAAVTGSGGGIDPVLGGLSLPYDAFMERRLARVEQQR
jgi:arylsulfatase A-like enzyme